MSVKEEYNNSVAVLKIRLNSEFEINYKKGQNAWESDFTNSSAWRELFYTDFPLSHI